MKIWIFTLALFAAQSLSAGDHEPNSFLEGSTTAVANPDNPYDFVGRYHNEGLEAVRQAENFPCIDPVDRYVHYVRFVQDLYPEVSYSYEAMGKLFDEVGSVVDLSPERVIKLLESRGRLSSTFAPYLQRIFEALFDHGLEENDPQLLAADIIRIESELIDRYNPEFDQPSLEGELAMVLSNASLTRHSYAYWYAVAKDDTNGWNIILEGGCGQDDPIAARGGKFWKRLRQAWTDAVSFLTSDCDYTLVDELICRIVNAGAASAACCK